MFAEKTAKNWGTTFLATPCITWSELRLQIWQVSIYE